jgi:hypothetical protein
MTPLQSLERHIENSQVIGHEKGVELRGFEFLDERF